jgi:hypothetical protein
VSSRSNRMALGQARRGVVGIVVNGRSVPLA